ncbi:MAG: DUF3089 domain-containing protein [Chitinophagaceae bacterium]
MEYTVRKTTTGQFNRLDLQQTVCLSAGAMPAIAMAILLLIWLSGCVSAPKYQLADYTTSNVNTLPDYNQLYYWAAHPYKWDPSDSLPKPFRKNRQDTTVDVFFIYPTTYGDNAEIADEPNGGPRWNANINDAALNAKTDYSTILNQASVFNQCRVFAPRYRQAHYRSFFVPDSVAKPFFNIAYYDVKTAFEFYLAHYNQGRPFIIAAHSQGTIHAARLIKEMVEGKPLAKKMIAAYLIGMPIRTDYFSSVVPCADSLQTGCFVSWRSFKEGYEAPFVAKETFTAAVVNPLNWQMNEEPVSRKFNNGTILFKFNKVKVHNIDARVKGNVLWTSKPRFFGNIFLTRTNYHIGDINFFWKNIRDNVQTRIRSFRKN